MATELQTKVERDGQLLRDAQARGRVATWGVYAKLSGPGWLQSAITLGGGSLSSSLYLGVLAGFSLLWLQPLAMILGIVMLSAIGYVTLSTGERPFHAINRHVNPVLGWGWAIATLAANVIWVLPQYSLANGVLQQNLLPTLFGLHAPTDPGALLEQRLLISVAILVIATAITWAYDSGAWGVKLYEILLKALVAVIVACFVGVVIKLGSGGLAWEQILAGFIPDFGAIFRPAATYQPFLDAVGTEYRSYWTETLVAEQRDVLISAAATAVGINMTFLFPYSLLKKGWGPEFRGLAVFDLSTGMLIPFVLATSCVVIASASQFHTVPQDGLLDGTKARADYTSLLVGRLKEDATLAALPDVELSERIAALPEAERRLAATLVKRDAFDLAQAISPLTGETFGNIVFGFGVLAMALSTITLLMLISGFVVCEMLGLEPSGWPHRLGTLAAATGVLWPFLWKGHSLFYLAVTASVIGFTLLPIAYLAFFFLMNQRRLLGEHMPRGGKLMLWNLLMGMAAALASVGSVYMLYKKAGAWGIVIVAVFGVLVLLGAKSKARVAGGS